MSRLSEARPEEFAALLDELALDEADLDEALAFDRVLERGRTSIHSSMTEKPEPPPTWRSALGALGVDADELDWSP